MSPEQRAELYEVQTRDLYALIGEFAAKFERFCAVLQAEIIFMCHANGLQNQKIARAMVSELTADPLLGMFHSIAIEFSKQDTLDLAILSKIRARATKLIETRNSVIHRTWYVGSASVDDTDFSSAHGQKDRRTKVGVSSNTLVVSEEVFRPLIQECEAVIEQISRCGASLIHGSGLQKNFAIQGNEVISLHAK